MYFKNQYSQQPCEVGSTFNRTRPELRGCRVATCSGCEVGAERDLHG